MPDTQEPVDPLKHGIGPATISGSGVIAGGDVSLAGEYVAGRDLIIHQHLMRPFEITSGIFQLPPDIGDFTGREEELETLRSWFTTGSAGNPGAIVIGAIVGKGGVGKTALAIHLAYQLREAYPDGQLYVNLRGVEAEFRDPSEVLAGFLRAFGVEGAAIPERVQERSAFYRDLLNERRVLVILDNAASESQVRPLLPGSRTCAVVVTSRTRLMGMEGARAYALDVMTAEAAGVLFGRIVGTDRVVAESAAAEKITLLCGYLPLAVRIAAARLAGRPHWRLARLLSRLEDEYRRLEELKVGDLSVRATFALSYEGLTETEQRAFRLLGLVRAPDFPAWVLSAVLGTDMSAGEELMECLADAQLLDVVGEDLNGQLRFRFHDLLRSFARERLREDGPQDDVLERLLGAYLALSKRALYLLSPNSKRDPLAPKAQQWLPEGLDPDTVVLPRPMDWFVAETAGIVAAVGQAFESRLWDMTWELADPLHYHFRVLALWKDWVATHVLGLEAARLAGNSRGEAVILRNLGNAYRDQGQSRKALECYENGLRIATDLESTLLSAFMLNGLGEVCLDRGRMAEAGSYFERSLAAWTAMDDLTGVAYTYTHLAMVYLQYGRLDEAMEYAERSLSMQREFRDTSGEGYALTAIGDIHRARGALDLASDSYQEALSIARGRGRLAEANATSRLGWISREQGALGDAAAAFTWARPVYVEFGDSRGEAEVSAGLAAVDGAEGRFDTAVPHLERVLGVAAGLDDALLQGRVLVILGDVHAAAGNRALAEAAWRQALDMFEEANSVQGESVRARLDEAR